MAEQDPFLRPAENLRETKRTLFGEPLRSRAQLDAFYRPIRESVRGQSVVPLLKDGLDRSLGDPRSKAFLMGRSGVGKSTEITKLLQEIDKKYVAVRFSTKEDIDALNFKPFDVLLLTAILLAERTHEVTGKIPDPNLIKQVLAWYDDVKVTTTNEIAASASLEAGIGAPDASWWTKVLGVFATLKGEVKYSASRSKETVDYSLNRIDTLLGPVNNLLLECHSLLYDHGKHEWLLVGEEFDKDYVPAQLTEDLFRTYGAILESLNLNMIFNLPLTLYYSSAGAGLPKFQRVMIYDTPVYKRDKSVNGDAMDDLRAILRARVKSDLFAQGQEDRLIIASGGQLRELFAIVDAACANARIQGSEVVEERHATRAIINVREEFKGRLSTELVEDKISLEMKLEKLVAVYNCNAQAQVPDATLNDLIRAGHVLDFNGEHWYGVHPLSVEILKTFGKLPENAGGGLP